MDTQSSSQTVKTDDRRVVFTANRTKQPLNWRSNSRLKNTAPREGSTDDQAIMWERKAILMNTEIIPSQNTYVKENKWVTTFVRERRLGLGKTLKSKHPIFFYK